DREAIRKRSLGIYGHYEQTVDRESAYEKLNARTEARTAGEGGAGAGTTVTQPSGSPTAGEGGITDALSKILLGSTGPRGGRREGMLEAAAKSAARSVGSSFGRAVLRAALGGTLRGGRVPQE